MAPRLQLHELLVSFVDNVYFQPPTNITLDYPCIIYKRDYAETEFADNAPYNHVIRYMVTVIDRDPDSDIPGKIAELPMSLFTRFFTVDNLNHDVYRVFF
jgi:hypothetical protein